MVEDIRNVWLELSIQLCELESPVYKYESANFVPHHHNHHQKGRSLTLVDAVDA